MKHALGGLAKPSPHGLPGTPKLVWVSLLAGSLGLTLWTLRAAGGWGPGWVDRLFTDGVFLALYVPAVAVCAVRARRAPEERPAWVLFALALVAQAGGFLLFALFVRGQASPPSPSVADVGWLTYYPLAFAGLVMLVKRRLAGFDRTLLLDGIIGALATAAIAAAVLLGPIASQTGGSAAAVATNLAYPLGDLHMAALVVATLGLTRWRPGWSWSVLGLGFLVAAAGDTVYLFQASSGTYVQGTALDAAWPAMALMLAASGWLPVPKAEWRRTRSWSSLTAPLTFTALAMALVAYAAFSQLGVVATALAIATLVTSQVRTVETFLALRRLDRQATEGPAEVLLAALAARDSYTGAHSESVVGLAGAVARRLGLSSADTLAVEQVALLHDVGKIGIPDSILQKRGSLSAPEWEQMRRHPVIGAQIVAGTHSLSGLAPMIRAEHERWDGGGYPDGLRGDEIPLASRIGFACDAYHAMTSDRPYRAAMPRADAVRELERNSGTQFDPEVITALAEEIADAMEHQGGIAESGAPARLAGPVTS